MIYTKKKNSINLDRHVKECGTEEFFLQKIYIKAKRH